MAGFVKCPECKYLVIDLRAPCPSCGAYVPAPAQVAPPVEPIPYHEQTQHHDDSRKGPSRKTIAIMLCAVILVVAVGAGVYYWQIRQERAALEAERAAQERIEQQRAAMIEQERLAAERAREEQERLAAERARMASGENTFRFPNGVSFNYPSGFEIEESVTDFGEFTFHNVFLTPSDSPDTLTMNHILVSTTENWPMEELNKLFGGLSSPSLGGFTPPSIEELREELEGLTREELEEFEELLSSLEELESLMGEFESSMQETFEELKRSLEGLIPPSIQEGVVMTETTIAGKDAFVTEISTSDFRSSFMRTVIVPFGNEAVVVVSNAFGDESTIDEFRAIAEGIENSLTFGE